MRDLFRHHACRLIRRFDATLARWQTNLEAQAAELRQDWKARTLAAESRIAELEATPCPDCVDERITRLVGEVERLRNIVELMRQDCVNAIAHWTPGGQKVGQPKLSMFAAKCYLPMLEEALKDGEPR